MAEVDDEREAFRRWEEFRRDQLTFVINVVLGLGTGLLGIIGLEIVNPSARPSLWNKIVIAASLAISIVAGLIASLVRLRSFRLSAKLARLRQLRAAGDRPRDLRRNVIESLALLGISNAAEAASDDQDDEKAAFKALRARSRALDQATYRLRDAQVAGFGGGALLYAIDLIVTYLKR